MASAADRTRSSRQWRLVLIGETGKGKSSFGNSILGRDFFETGSQPESITSECSTGSCRKCLNNDTNQELKIFVTDTIGLFDTQRDQDTIIQLIGEQIFQLTSPGPHAILIVCRIDRHTSHEEEVIDIIKSMFGPNAVKYCIFIFTYEDQLSHGQTIRNWINSSGRLRTLMSQYHNRYLSVNNKNVTEEKINELIAMINTMITVNGNEYYTNDEYRRIEQLRQFEKRQKAQEEEAKRLETERLRQEKQAVELQLANERLRRERAEQEAASRQQESSNEFTKLLLHQLTSTAIKVAGDAASSYIDHCIRSSNEHAQESSSVPPASEKQSPSSSVVNDQTKTSSSPPIASDLKSEQIEISVQRTTPLANNDPISQRSGPKNEHICITSSSQVDRPDVHVKTIKTEQPSPLNSSSDCRRQIELLIREKTENSTTHYVRNNVGVLTDSKNPSSD